MVISFSDFSEVFNEYMLNKSKSIESIGSIIDTIINALIQLAKAIFTILTTIFSKITKVILFHLSSVSSNTKILKKDLNNQKYEEKLTNNIVNCIGYSQLVDYINTFSTVNKDITSSFNLTDIDQQIDTYIKLPEHDTGEYLKPTKFPLTEQFFRIKLKDNLEKLGIFIEPINSEISNQDVVLTKINISTTDKLISQEKSLKDLGFTVKGFVNTVENSYKQLQYSIQNIEIYKTFFNKIQSKLNIYKSKNNLNQEGLDNPNHKLNRIRLLIENISVSTSLYGRFLIINNKIISIMSSISTLLVN